MLCKAVDLQVFEIFALKAQFMRRVSALKICWILSMLEFLSVSNNQLHKVFAPQTLFIEHGITIALSKLLPKYFLFLSLKKSETTITKPHRHVHVAYVQKHQVTDAIVDFMKPEP
jgi:hypothetical protein